MSPGSPSKRLYWLDALRGIAALGVVVSHTLIVFSPTTLRLMADYIDIGEAAVTVFFLTSGMVIPVSLHRSTLRAFWIRRLCRIYPLYLVTVVIITILTLSNLFSDPLVPPLHISLGLVLANLPMLQWLLGMRNIVTQSWTLFYELLFYVLVSLLWIWNVQNTMRVTLVLCLMGFGIGMFIPFLFKIGNALLYLSLMCGGTLVADWRAGKLPGHLVIMMLAAILLGLNATYNGLSPAFMSARFLGIVVFGVAVLLQPQRVPSVLRWLGTISYSVYLLHMLVIAIVPPADSLWLTLLQWIGGTLLIAPLGYYGIERPAQNWAKHQTAGA